jgi:hypothetical protein
LPTLLLGTSVTGKEMTCRRDVLETACNMEEYGLLQEVRLHKVQKMKLYHCNCTENPTETP